MAIGGSLPQVGAHAVILGMAAFSNNTRSVNAQLRSMAQSAYYLERTSTRAFDGVDASITGMAGAFIKAGATIGGIVATIAAASTVLGQRYGKEVAFAGAISESTTAQVAKLDAAQLELSRHSNVSALAMTQFSQELLKAGLSIDDVTGGALRVANAMVVASNGELEAARAAGILQVGMASFNVQAAEVERISNATTAAVQRSAINFTQFADAMRQGGPAAAAVGLSFEEFAATIGVVGKQMNSGTSIGTGLRVALQQLQAPTAAAREEIAKYGLTLYDVNGATRPWFDVLTSLENSLGRQAVETGKVTEAQRDFALATIFGTRSVQALKILLDEGTGAYLQMLDATQRLSAQNIADEILRDTANAAVVAQRNIEALGIAFNKGLDPFVNHAIRSLVRFLQSLDIQQVQAFGRAVGSTLYNAFSTVGVVMGQVIPIMARVGSAFLAAASTIGILTSAAASAFNLGGVLAAAGADLMRLPADAANAAAGVAAALGTIVTAVQSNTAAVFVLRGVFVAAVVGGALLAIEALGALIVSMATAAVASTGAAGRIAVAWAFMTASVLAESAAIAIAIGANLVQALYTFGVVVATVTTAAVGAFIQIATTATLSAANTARAFAVIAAQALFAFARVAVAASITAAAAFIRVMAAATISAVAGMLAAFGPLLLGVAAIGGAAALLAKAWGDNWGGIQGIVGRAVQWIIGKLNEFLDALSALPVIGEFIGGARAAVSGFLGAVPTFTAVASTAIQGFVSEAIAGFNAVRNIQMPNFESFTSELEAARAAADAAADAAKRAAAERVPFRPANETEPGVIPGGGGAGGGGGGAAKKAAEELANAIERARELVRDFNDDVIKETTKVTNDIAKLYDRAGLEMEASMDKATKAITEVIEESNRKILDLELDRAIKEDVELRRSALEGMLEEEARIRDEALEIIEQQHDWEIEDTKRANQELREIARREEDARLEALARARQQKREDEDRDFDRSQQNRERNLDKELEGEERAARDRADLRERELNKRQDDEERALSKLHDTREAALKAQLDQQAEALRASQDQREAALQAQLDAESRQRDEARDLAEINRKDTEARAKAEAEYTRELALGVKQSIAQARFNDKIAKTQADTDADMAAFEKRKADAAADLEFEAQQEAKLNALRAQFDTEDKELKAKSETELNNLKVANENAMLELRARHEAQSLELRRQTEQEMTRLHEEHERRRIELSDRLEAEALARSRKRADEDRAYDEFIEGEKRKFATKQEKEALDENRKLQDDERIRRNKLDIEETAFKREQEEKRAALAKQLEQEEFDRKLANIRLEHDKRITQINATLEEEQRKTREKLAQDITDLNQNLAERIETIRSQYIDKLEDIMRQGGDKISPLVDEITGNIAAGLESITTAANDAVKALGDALGASERLGAAQQRTSAAQQAAGEIGAPVRPGGKPGESYDEAANFLRNTGSSEREIEALIGKPRQYGGEIPGPYGSPQLVVAHGGERYEGIGHYGVAMTAIRMAESMMARGTQGSSITNNYDYTVNANYGRMQEAGSISQDLSALLIATRR